MMPAHRRPRVSQAGLAESDAIRDAIRKVVAADGEVTTVGEIGADEVIQFKESL